MAYTRGVVGVARRIRARDGRKGGLLGVRGVIFSYFWP